MPTCEQVANARMLALTLEKVAPEYPEHFHMSWFLVGKLDEVGDTSIESEQGRVLHRQGAHPETCGTSGCALGWAPYATGLSMLEGEGFEEYAQRVLGIGDGGPIDITDDPDDPEFIRLFMDFSEPNSGAEGAQRAAQRLWEWVAEHEGDCTEEAG